MAEYFPHRPYPVPRNESSRLEMVRRLEFLTDPKLAGRHRAGLDRVCALARSLLGVEMAFVTLLFAEEQRFVARANIDATSVPRELTFCTHTIAQEGPMVIPDARLDARFADNPFVRDGLKIRFYAGAPIEYGGHAVGTFCVLDNRPRELDAKEREQLDTLTELVIEQIEQLVEIGDLQRQAVLLRQSEQLAKVGGWEIDVEAQRVLWSEELYRLHEVDPSVPVTYDMLPAFYPNGESERLGDAVRAAAETGLGFEIDVTYVTSSGAERSARILAETEPRVGRTPRILGSFRDLTQEKRIEAEWLKAQLCDAVTGLPNRVRIEARLGDACAEGEAGVLVLVGLDGFKAINEERGRAAGDAVLRAVGAALTVELGSETLVARLGGDEFAVVISGRQSGHEILQLVQRITQVVERAFTTPNGPRTGSTSLGVAVFPDDAQIPGDIVQAAEIALRKAKVSGGRRIEYFAPELRSRIEQKVQVLADVRRGLEASEFLLHYQPICDASGRARGFEALMRWQHGERGLLAPFHFMLAFDDPELSITLGELALRSAIHQMSRWQRAGVDFGYVAVNLSSSQLAQEDLTSQVSSLLRMHGVEAKRLMLEVTESVYLDGNRERIVRTLAELRMLGVTFALDDFGTGYASLTHLQQFPIDRIKVDRSFVKELGRSEPGAAIVRAIVSLGRALRIQVVAEGVETAQQLAFLQGLGCDLIQGFYFAKPMPANECAAFCQRPLRAASELPPSLRSAFDSRSLRR